LKGFMSRKRPSVHLSASETSKNTQTHNGRRRWIALVGTTVAAIAGMTALASSASAHDAPPNGSASCTTTGPTYDWQVADGSTLVENTSGAQWKVSFASSAGQIAPTGGTTGTGDTASGPGFTVTGISSTVASITVTSTLVWGTPPDYTDGTADKTVTIDRPIQGCDSSLAVPGTPAVTAPTCSTAGSLAVPADTPSVVWSESPTYHAGDAGTFTVTATAQNGYFFSGGSKTHDYVLTVAPRVTGSPCYAVVTPVAPATTAGACTTPGQHSDATVTIPVTPGVVYTIGGKGSDVSGRTLTEPVGTTLTVVATPAAGYKFTGAQSVSDVVTLANPGTCLAPATPTVPSISQSVCTGPGSDSVATLVIPSNVKGVIYQINGTDVSGTIAEARGTTVIVKAIPALGYVFAAGTTTSWTEDFADVGNCFASATVVKPGFSNDVCSAGQPAHSASYTIPSTKHVAYRVNGSAVAAGTHSAANGSTITVAAIADTGYSLGNSTSSWTHTFAQTPVCHAKASQVTHKAQPVHQPATVNQPQSTTALASTGVPTASMIVGGVVIVLLGLAFLLAGGVMGRKNRA
jgi:large repetitive protein